MKKIIALALIALMALVPLAAAQTGPKAGQVGEAQGYNAINQLKMIGNVLDALFTTYRAGNGAALGMYMANSSMSNYSSEVTATEVADAFGNDTYRISIRDSLQELGNNASQIQCTTAAVYQGQQGYSSVTGNCQTSKGLGGLSGVALGRKNTLVGNGSAGSNTTNRDSLGVQFGKLVTSGLGAWVSVQRGFSASVGIA